MLEVTFVSVVNVGYLPKQVKLYFLKDTGFTNSVKERFTTSYPYNSENRLIKSEIKTFLKVFELSAVFGNIFLCSSVFFMNARYDVPAYEQNLPAFMYNLHYAITCSLFVCLMIQFHYFFKLLDLATPEFQRIIHSANRKKVYARLFYVSLAGLMVSNVMSRMVNFYHYDFVALFEYAAVIFQALFLVDIWSGLGKTSGFGEFYGTNSESTQFDPDSRKIECS